MDWQRVATARATARTLLAVPSLVIAFLLFAGVSSPIGPAPTFGPTVVLTMTGIESSRDADGIPIGMIPQAVGVLGLLIGLAWMWRIYRAPTKSDGALWRYRDR